MVGLVVIPFVARPVLKVAFEMDEKEFNRLLDERREMLPRLILNSLRPS
jgi:hypothetical protein